MALPVGSTQKTIGFDDDMQPFSGDDITQALLPKPSPPPSVVRSWISRHRQDLVAIICLQAVIFGGAAMFWAFMGYKPASDGETDNLAWTYFNCVYFVVQILCAIGYGDFSPASLPVAAQVIFPFFSYVALGVSWVALQSIPDFAESLLKGFLRRCCKMEGEIRWLGIKTKIVLAATIQLTAVLLGALVFSYLEQWDYHDSVYYVIVTITTIGYGDFVPVTYGGRSFFIFFALFTMGGFFWYFELAADYVIQQAREKRLQAVAGTPGCGKGVRYWLNRNKRWIFALLFFFIFVAVGGLISFIVEGGAFIDYNPLVEPPPVLPNQTFAWTYGSSMYACLQIITAVNYADFIPVTYGGKIFVCVYALVGLLVFTLCVAEIAAHMIATGATVFVIRLRKGGTGVVRRRGQPRAAAQSPPIIVGPMTRSQRLYRWAGTELGRTVTLAIAYGVWCMVCAGLFTAVEIAAGNADFFYGPTLFWSFQCVTTGGFGVPTLGQYPTTVVARFIWVPYVFVGLFLVTAMLTAAGELAESLVEKAATKLTGQAPYDAQAIGTIGL
eukprot:TRINITY_DN2785_c0_g1_i1.p1 TRINITY_DN2785_c0_g1~~TRINITY_DN2785_c0_g1_i1.p1  ORF type:complete len:569 (+),score=128.03 TRINITY_DN2785_c0_g1_i1:46-1707(+)